MSLKHIGSHSDRSDGLANKQDFDRLKLDRNKNFASLVINRKVHGFQAVK
ncbi:MAG: hypothetical protein RSE19_03530 [Myroides sp.]